jgi:nucleotide-binding universal stress UspA family protein
LVAFAALLLMREQPLGMKSGIELATEGRDDAILVGARGLGRISALVGSVSRYVLHHADVAVFVAHAPRDAEPPNG